MIYLFRFSPSTGRPIGQRVIIALSAYRRDERTPAAARITVSCVGNDWVGIWGGGERHENKKGDRRRRDHSAGARDRDGSDRTHDVFKTTMTE